MTRLHSFRCVWDRLLAELTVTHKQVTPTCARGGGGTHEVRHEIQAYCTCYGASTIVTFPFPKHDALVFHFSGSASIPLACPSPCHRAGYSEQSLELPIDCGIAVI